MRFNTKSIHAGQKPEETSGAVMPPIFQTSTYAQEAPGQHKGHDYARVSNPTRTNLENLIAGLEGADECACFASGCAATDAIAKQLRPGDHLITNNDLYGGTYRLFRQVFEPYNIDFSFVDMTDLDTIRDYITDATTMFWVETPTNPLLNVCDIEQIASLADEHGITMIVDNTFASPYLQNPLELGADAVMHSTTKYLGGHSDIIGGAVASSDEEFMDQIKFQVKTTGAVPGPMDCYLTLRGIKTLPVRMKEAVSNARQIAEFLETQSEVGEVLYPGLPNHPHRDTAEKQMKDFGAMVTFSLADDSMEKAHRFMSNTQIFTLAESLGGVESLISHPASMTHASIPHKERLEAGLKDSMIRLSVGIEDAQDLTEDIRQALDSI